MGDTKLLAKLSEEDMIAEEACYHEHCMTKFRNKFRKFSNDHENHVKDVQKSLEAIAVVECMSFTEHLNVSFINATWEQCMYAV